MAKEYPKKKKTRTHIVTSEQEVDEVPKSFIIRRTRMDKEGKHLEKNLRELMYPFTTMNLKESLKLKIKDILDASRNFGAKNLIFITNKNSNLYLKFMKTPHGPTFTFKILKHVLSKDLQSLIPRNKNVNIYQLGVPMVICKGFEGGLNSNQQHLSLMHGLFRNLFPGLSYFKDVKANTFKRCVMFYFNKKTNQVEIRNYFMRRTFTGMNNNIKKIVNTNQIPNFANLDDVADLFVENEAALSDSDIDFLPNSKVDIEDKILGHRKKHQMNIRLYVF